MYDKVTSEILAILHSMVNIKIYKCFPQICVLALSVSDIYKFKIYYFQKVGQSHGVHFSQLHHSMANVKIYKCLPHIPTLALTISDNFWTFKK